VEARASQLDRTGAQGRVAPASTCGGAVAHNEHAARAAGALQLGLGADVGEPGGRQLRGGAEGGLALGVGLGLRVVPETARPAPASHGPSVRRRPPPQARPARPSRCPGDRRPTVRGVVAGRHYDGPFPARTPSRATAGRNRGTSSTKGPKAWRPVQPGSPSTALSSSGGELADGPRRVDARDGEPAGDGRLGAGPGPPPAELCADVAQPRGGEQPVARLAAVADEVVFHVVVVVVTELARRTGRQGRHVGMPHGRRHRRPGRAHLRQDSTWASSSAAQSWARAARRWRVRVGQAPVGPTSARARSASCRPWVATATRSPSSADLHCVGLSWARARRTRWRSSFIGCAPLR
jgi:hypothetical protein